MRKKAILFTLGMVFLALSLLSLSFLIYRNSLSSREIDYNAIASIRMQNLFSAADYHFTSLFYNNTGFKVTKNETGITFRHNLDDNFNAFFINANKYNNIVNKVYGVTSTMLFNSTEMFFNITKSLKATSSQIAYNVYSGTGNKTIVIYDEPSVSSYTIRVNSTDSNGTAGWGTVSPGNTNFVIIVEGQSGWRSTSQQQISTSSFSFAGVSGFANSFNITINGGNVTIRTDTGNLILEATLNFSAASNEVLLPVKIDYNMSSSNVFRSYYPRIL